MKTIDVNLGKRSYPIRVEKGLLNRIPEVLSTFGERKWIIVTQKSVLAVAGTDFLKSLDSGGIDAGLITIPEGEEAKSLSQAASVYRRLLEQQCDRSTLLVALGGGVVGDVTGFVAATYLRGVDYVQIPTTLLAMVDSAIGGKTGVNLSQGKNLVGVFYQPRAVIVDPAILRFLPLREMASALAEVLKYGAIQDREFFMNLKSNMSSLLSLDNMDYLTEVIERCCKLKADIVSQDEREGDLRRILNFGHTVGHALETASSYKVLKHGEAIAYGMMAAGEISFNLGFLPQEDRELLGSTIRQLPLPELPQLEPEELLQTIRHDKKVRAGRLRFVVLGGLGDAFVTDIVSDENILEAVRAL